MDDRIKNHGMQFVGTAGNAVPPPNPPPAGDKGKNINDLVCVFLKQQEEQQKLVDQWNAMHPIGTPVTRYKLVNPLREPEQTRTRSEAWLMGGHTAVVKVEGVSGGVMLDSIRISEGVPPPDHGRGQAPNPPPAFGVSAQSNAGNMKKTHELKCWPDYFAALLEGKKTFEVRYDDRGYNVGDVLSLREYSPADAQYTGRVVNMRVTYIWSWRSFGLLPNWVVMAIISTGNAKL